MNQLWHPILGIVPKTWTSVTCPKIRGLARTKIKGQGQGQRSTWQCRDRVCIRTDQSVVDAVLLWA